MFFPCEKCGGTCGPDGKAIFRGPGIEEVEERIADLEEQKESLLAELHATIEIKKSLEALEAGFPVTERCNCRGGYGTCRLHGVNSKKEEV